MKKKKDRFLSKISRYFSNLDRKEKNEEKSTTTPSSVRLTGEIVNKLDEYSSLLGINKPSLINHILRQAFFSDDIKYIVSDEIDVIESRIWYLFNSHLLNKVDILSLINECKKKNAEPSIALPDLIDVLKIVNSNLIDHLSEFFEINPDWILGVSDNMLKIHRNNWYMDFSKTVDELITEYQKNSEISFYMIKDDSIDLNNAVNKIDLYKEHKSGAYLTAVLVKPKKLPNNKIIYIANTYSCSNGSRWSYYKTRHKFKQLYLVAEKLKYTLPSGYTLKEDDFKAIVNGKKSAIGLYHSQNLDNIHKEVWHIDDYVSSNKFTANKEKEDATLVVEIFNSDKNILDLLIKSELYKSLDEIKINPPSS